MPATFSRTLRSLEADRRRRPYWELVLLAILAAWGGWMVLGRVTVYRVSRQARLESQGRPHPVESAVEGQIAVTHLAVGSSVQTGDLLVELDSETLVRSIEERTARRDGLAARVQAIEREIVAEESAAAAGREALAAGLDVARARVVEAEARLEVARRLVATQARLRMTGVATEEQLAKAKSEARAGQAAVEALALEIVQLTRQHRVDEADRHARMAKLTGENVQIAGEQAVESAAIRRIEHDVELRRIRAPVAGRIGHVAAKYRVGSVVQPGDELATIVPAGDARAVAEFASTVSGRVRPGQTARLRLDGYPWTQYGDVPASVADVASEARSDLVRVELSLAPRPQSAIPIEHGLTGEVEVAVERVSPAVLVLRAAGQWLAGRAAEDPAP